SIFDRYPARPRKRAAPGSFDARNRPKLATHDPHQRISQVLPASARAFSHGQDPKPTSSSPSMNDLVSFRKYLDRDGYAKSPSGLEVDYELVRQRCLDGQVAWTGASEDIVRILCHLARCFAKARPISNEPSGIEH